MGEGGGALRRDWKVSWEVRVVARGKGSLGEIGGDVTIEGGFQAGFLCLFFYLMFRGGV